jgi:formamidopyrimidine-DNA glycosylase
MPELPEVETVRRALLDILPGRRLERVEVRRRDLRFPLPDDFEARLEGRRIEGLDRRAKYLLANLNDGTTWITHLGMTGALIDDAAASNSPHAHIRFSLDDGRRLVFRDARRFGFMALAETATLAEHAYFRHLGPEPLEAAFDGPELARRLKGRTGPIKTAIMDQKVVVGVGNIYASEALNRAGLSPRRKAGTVAGARADRLAAAIKATLADAIAAGGSSIRDYVSPSGAIGDFQLRVRVYGREGEPCSCCACASPIQRIVQAGRSTFFCPTFQR